MSLILYCRCHVTDKQLSAWTYVTVMVYLRTVTRISSSTEQASVSLT